MRILATVCCSRNPIENQAKFPRYYNYVDSLELAPRGTVSRALKVAAMRNIAMAAVIRKWPETTHILMVDEYYMSQDQSIISLCLDAAKFDSECIVGASTWVLSRRDTIRKTYRFYDWGTTPECMHVPFNSVGIPRVNAVGACYIFPIEAWLKNGYNPNTIRFETEHISLCRGFPTYIDLNVKLFRPDREKDACYPLHKAMRVKLGAWRRKVHV